MATDCRKIMPLMQKPAGEAPKFSCSGIVGFGRYHYKGASGREGEWFVTGISPRKANLSLYILSGLGKETALLEKLGKHSTGKDCLYIKRLNDVDPKVLEELIEKGVKGMEKVRVR